MSSLFADWSRNVQLDFLSDLVVRNQPPGVELQPRHAALPGATEVCVGQSPLELLFPFTPWRNLSWAGPWTARKT